MALVKEISYTEVNHQVRSICQKMPKTCYALVLIIDGVVENPEFVVWGRDDFSYFYWRWVKLTYPNINRKRHIKYFVKYGNTWATVNPASVAN